MDLSFLAPSRPVPVGGVLSLYKFAESLLEYGHQVRIVHVDFFDMPPAQPSEMEHLVRFDPRVTHEVIDRFEGDLDGGDAVFCFDDRVPRRAGLPLMWIQAVGGFPWEQDAAVFGHPCPKVCTSSWLEYVARRVGNPDHQTVLATYGVDTSRFAATQPIEDRPRSVVMLYNPHPIKGAATGVAALVAAKRAIPDLQATLFGTSPRPADLPDWIDFRLDPSQHEVASLYRNHRAYLMPSWIEGFGITGIEAHAAATPLIVTANGGSADYAEHAANALVARTGDIDGLTAHIVRVMSDDALANRLSAAGPALAATFTWQRSAAVINDLLERYVAEPEPHQAPVDLKGLEYEPEVAGTEDVLNVWELLEEFNAGRAMVQETQRDRAATTPRRPDGP